MPPLLQNIITMAQSCGITFPPSLPIYHSPPNQQHLQEWAESQITPRLRKIARKMISNLRYISFDDFLVAMRKTIVTFHEKIGEEPFVLVVTGDSSKAEKGCSDRWIPAIALQYAGLKPPCNIVTTDMLEEFLRNNPNVKNILLLDDASYSGSQKVLDILQINAAVTRARQSEAHETRLHVAVPFFTEDAVKNINGALDGYKDCIKVNFIGHEKMPSLLDTFDNEDFDYLDKITTIADNLTLTYFDHKYADHWSTYQNIYTGAMIKFDLELLLKFLGYTMDAERAQQDPGLTLITKDELLKLMPNLDLKQSGYNIPTIIKPYALSEKDYQKLESAITHGDLGIRSEYPVINPKMKAIISKTPLTAKTRFDVSPYMKTEIPLELQEEFDRMVDSMSYSELQEYKKTPSHSTHSKLS